MKGEIQVRIFDKTVGYLAEDDKGTVHFEYENSFKDEKIEISPLKLNTNTTTTYINNDDKFFQGLAGVFHDSLPDKFGNKIIDEYYAKKGIQSTELSLLQRLAYIGTTGMGALEYIPSEPHDDISEALEIKELVDEARAVISGDAKIAIPELMESGGSAGGARAKAVIAWNKETNEIKSGRSKLDDNFEHYIFKFDGVGQDKRPADYTKVEYMYMKIARDLGLNVSEVELFNDRNYSHLVVKRFDRIKDDKVHMHTLCGLTHKNFNLPGLFSYEEYIRTVMAVTNSDEQVQHAILHMIYNVISVNQDDHTKNFSFLMDKQGVWTNSPIYDLTYSKGSDYTKHHQLFINGKRDDFVIDDLLKVTRIFDYPDEMVIQLIKNITEAFEDKVTDYSNKLSIAVKKRDRILDNMRKL